MTSCRLLQKGLVEVGVGGQGRVAAEVRGGKRRRGILPPCRTQEGSQEGSKEGAGSPSSLGLFSKHLPG